MGYINKFYSPLEHFFEHIENRKCDCFNQISLNCTLQLLDASWLIYWSVSHILSCTLIIYPGGKYCAWFKRNRRMSHSMAECTSCHVDDDKIKEKQTTSTRGRIWTTDNKKDVNALKNWCCIYVWDQYDRFLNSKILI